MIESHEQSRRDRLAPAYQSLEGLHCDDAFGERFFVREELALSLIRKKAVPRARKTVCGLFPLLLPNGVGVGQYCVGVLNEHFLETSATSFGSHRSTECDQQRLAHSNRGWHDCWSLK